MKINLIKCLKLRLKLSPINNGNLQKIATGWREEEHINHGPWIQGSVRPACDAILEQFTCTLMTKLNTVENNMDTLIERIASVEERVTRLEAAN